MQAVSFGFRMLFKVYSHSIIFVICVMKQPARIKVHYHYYHNTKLFDKKQLAVRIVLYTFFEMTIVMQY